MIDLSIKDFFLIVTTLGTAISLYFALKYKATRNQEKNEELSGGFGVFKKFVYKELKDIEEKLEKINNNFNSMLDKNEAEIKFISRIEHDLTMKNIDLQLQTIVDKLDDLKKG